MQSLRSLLLLSLAACGLMGPSQDAGEATDRPAVVKPWVKAVMSEEAMQRSAEGREPMRFTLGEGSLRMELMVDGAPVVGTLKADMAALRIANVPTLDLPVGFVRFDPLGLALEGGSSPVPVVEALFRRLGAPVQLFLEVHSVGAMQGRLASVPSEARGEIVGVVQIDDRQVNVAIPARFRRTAADTLEVDFEGYALPLEEAGMEKPFERLRSVLGARRIEGTTVRISGRASFKEFKGDVLPGFVRTPITVNTVEQLAARFDKEVAPADAMRVQLAVAGFPPELTANLSEEDLARMMEAIQHQRDVRDGKVDGSVLDNPPPKGVRSGVRTEGGVEIRD